MRRLPIEHLPEIRFASREEHTSIAARTLNTEFDHTRREMKDR